MKTIVYRIIQVDGQFVEQPICALVKVTKIKHYGKVKSYLKGKSPLVRASLVIEGKKNGIIFHPEAFGALGTVAREETQGPRPTVIPLDAAVMSNDWARDDDAVYFRGTP